MARMHRAQCYAESPRAGNRAWNKVPLEYVPAIKSGPGPIAATSGERRHAIATDRPGGACRDGSTVLRFRRGLRRSGGEEGLHAAVLHDGRRQDDQERQGRLRNLRQAQRRRRQRHLHPALLLGQLRTLPASTRTPTRRSDTGTRSSVPAGRSTPTSTSSSARTRWPTSIPRIRTRRPPGRHRSIRTPASRTGCPFPVVSYVDSVRVHKALLDSLGVTKLKAVAGARRAGRFRRCCGPRTIPISSNVSCT